MKIAIVRVRGSVRVNKKIVDTLNMLRLYNKNYCVIVENTPQIKGMINKIKDFVTYGEIDGSFVNELISKKGQEYVGREKDSKEKISYKRKYYEIDGKKYKKFFRLSPPKKGFGRNGIKKPYKSGGALGDRKDKIAELIRRMI